MTDGWENSQACGIDPQTLPQLQRTTFYTSHEALLLPYEQALTRLNKLRSWLSSDAGGFTGQVIPWRY